MRHYTTLFAAAMAKASTRKPRVIKRHTDKPGYYVMAPSEANRCRLADGWTGLTERLPLADYLRVKIAALEAELRAVEMRK